MPKKRIQKKTKVASKWMQRHGTFTYEIVDPIEGGLWVYSAKREMTDEELYFQLVVQITFNCVERPKKGQVIMLHPVA